ncbi:uncharacterized protein LOC116299109 [Actinia tenebrosa]|uniref:Uncharacterized protein LOC116299109 n=1 Tax=Actinia tenebrosa TaxID=6105 RepID=A0A6P8IDM9_ACTTE|nr:uncharacterized protein LOC116299109 [Actinia tenebrosa]
MSVELEVAFAWKSIYITNKVELLICRAAGIYKDPFETSIDAKEISVYELERSNRTDTNTLVKVISLTPGIYHFVFRAFRSKDGDCKLITSDFYDKTCLATGREVNYVEVLAPNHHRSLNYSSISTREDSFHTAYENFSDSSKAPLLDNYDHEEKGLCCTLL